MRIVRQKRPFSTYDVFQIRVWKKRVYIRGWYAQIQIGQRAWLLFPKDKDGPPAHQVKRSA